MTDKKRNKVEDYFRALKKEIKITKEKIETIQKDITDLNVGNIANAYCNLAVLETKLSNLVGFYSFLNYIFELDKEQEE